MRKKIIIWLSSLIILTGCAFYHIDVNGFLNPKYKLSFIPGSSFDVFVNEKAANPLLENEVASKISSALKKKGYRLASIKDAKYLLMFLYGMGRAGEAVVSSPDFVFGGHEVYSISQHDRWLHVRVLDADYLRKTKKFSVVWQGSAISTGSSRDLRTVIGYLVDTLFKYFGQDTGKQVREIIPASIE